MHRNLVKSNNIPLRGDNIQLLYNGQYKTTTLIKQDEFMLKSNGTNAMDI